MEAALSLHSFSAVAGALGTDIGGFELDAGCPGKCGPSADLKGMDGDSRVANKGRTVSVPARINKKGGQED